MIDKTKVVAKFSFQVDRCSVTGEVTKVVITASWEGVRRYQASFLKKVRKNRNSELGLGNRRNKESPVAMFNAQRFDERGEHEASNIFIPASVLQEMRSRAIAIIFPK